MLKKPKQKSATRISEKCEKNSNTTTDNLYVSPLLIDNFQKNSTRKQNSHFSKSSSNAENEKTSPKKVPKDKRLTPNLPKDAAIHFGSFYGVQGNTDKPRSKIKRFLESATPTFYETTPRLEFTRQMVQKLERTAGTKDYARQVSALLEETVEPAHFKLHPPPEENSIPDGRYNPTGYPLWYKDPYKMSFNSDEIYKLLMEKYDNCLKKAKDVFEEKEDDFEEKISNDDQLEGDEDLQDIGVDRLTSEEKLSLNILSHECSSAVEVKSDDQCS